MSNVAGITIELLEKLVPFFLEWDDAGALRFLSRPLAKVWGDESLISVERSLMLSRPFQETFSSSWLAELTDLTVHLYHCEKPEAPLKGQVIAKEGGWLFVGYPIMKSISDLDGFGIKLSDLPVHDGVGDLLIATEASRTSLLETQKVAADLEAVNRRLIAVNESFSRFVPQGFLDELGCDSAASVSLGDRVGTDKCVMFADLRQFTTISESMEPSEIFKLINRYLSIVAPCIRDNEGFVCHYLGDGIMALFPGGSNGAVEAAVAMQSAIKGLDGELRNDFFRLKIGIGIHYGHLELGIVGEAERWDSSVIADAVNTAARVEGLTKLFRAEILLTQAVTSQLEDPSKFEFRRLGKVGIKGRSAKVNLFEVLDSLSVAQKSLKMTSKPQFEEALMALENTHFLDARRLFTEILQANPADGAAQFYLKRLASAAETSAASISSYLR